MDDLIARLAAASEGSRELDLDIARAIYPLWQFRIEPAVPALLMGSRVMVTTESGADEHVNIASYTTSLDDALTLVRREWDNLRFARTGGTWGCFLDAIDTNAATPILALCIAALKAISAAGQQEPPDPLAHDEAARAGDGDG